MRHSIIIASLVVAYSALGSEQVGAQNEPNGVSTARFDELLRDGDAVRGRAVVVGATPQGQAGACMQCHRLDGSGDAVAGFPRLDGLSARYLLKSLRDYASGARASPVMAPIAKAMSRAEMVDSAVYYAAQVAEPPLLREMADPSVLQRGGAIAAVGDAGLGVQACQNCHGPSGVGLGSIYPALAGQHAVYLETQLRAWKSGARRDDPGGAMALVARRLGEDEIRAVSAYFASLPAIGAENAVEARR